MTKPETVIVTMVNDLIIWIIKTILTVDKCQWDCWYMTGSSGSVTISNKIKICDEPLQIHGLSGIVKIHQTFYCPNQWCFVYTNKMESVILLKGLISRAVYELWIMLCQMYYCMSVNIWFNINNSFYIWPMYHSNQM